MMTEAAVVGDYARLSAAAASGLRSTELDLRNFNYYLGIPSSADGGLDDEGIVMRSRSSVTGEKAAFLSLRAHKTLVEDMPSTPSLTLARIR